MDSQLEDEVGGWEPIRDVSGHCNMSAQGAHGSGAKFTPNLNMMRQWVQCRIGYYSHCIH